MDFGNGKSHNFLKAALEAKMQTHSQSHPGRAAGRRHRTTVREGQRQWLFAQYVLAGASGGEHNRRMPRIWRCDKHGIDIWVVHTILECVVGSRDRQALGEGACRRSFPTGAGDDLCRGRAPHGRHDFFHGMSAEADQTPA